MEQFAPGTRRVLASRSRSGCGGGWTSDCCAAGAGRAPGPARGAAEPVPRRRGRRARAYGWSRRHRCRWRSWTRPTRTPPGRWSTRPRPSRSTWSAGRCCGPCWSGSAAEDHVLLLGTAPHRRRRLVGRRAAARPDRRLPRAGRRDYPELPAAPVRVRRLRRTGSAQTLTGPRLDRRTWTTGASACAGVPPLELPIDRPRPATQTFDGDWHVGSRSTRRAHRRAGRARPARTAATLFMTLLAAYQVLLSRYAGQDDFAVGSSVGRAVRCPELEDVVGMFINMLPLRAELAGDPTFAELLERTRRTVLDGFEHAEVPFERLVNELGVPRDVSRSPVFQAMFVLQNYEMGRFPGRRRPASWTFEWMPIELRRDPVRPGAARWWRRSGGLLGQARLQHRPVRAGPPSSGWRGQLARAAARGRRRPRTVRCPQLDLLGRRTSGRWCWRAGTTPPPTSPPARRCRR